MHSPLEVAKNYVEIGVHKVKLSAFKMIILGIFAGMYVAFAGTAAQTAAATIANPSVGRLVSACVFPAGLAMVLIAGSELFTGNNLIIISVLEKKVTVLQMLKNWFFVFLGNSLGASLVGVAVVYSGIPALFEGQQAERMVSVAMLRVNQTFSEAFLRGVLCNILVCIAVWAAFASKRVSGKLMMSFWPIMVFVLCGFEHCVADIYYGVSGILTAARFDIVAPGLEFGRFFTNCILPVTLGNIVGGAGIVGVGYWAMYLLHTPGSTQTQEEEQKEIDMAEEYFVKKDQ